MNTDKDALNRLSWEIIRCTFVVSNTLGVVFLEKVYENALVHEPLQGSSDLRAVTTDHGSL
jgi:hypothetical protein